MEKAEKTLEKVYQRQVDLYQKLRDCLEVERQKLVGLDVEAIWDLLEQKERIMEEIQETMRWLEPLKNEGYSGSPLKQEMAATKRAPILRDLKRELTILKEDIRLRVRENVAFIRETLGFFDGLVSVFTNRGQKAGFYGPSNASRQENQPIIYSKEV
jgi:hypothetical protein